MSWYRAGTITLTPGSTTVNGVGTAWVEAVLPAAMLLSQGAPLEVERVVSDTELRLKIAYAGAGGAGLAYAIAPTQGHLVEASRLLMQYLESLSALDQAWRDGSLRGDPGAGLVFRGDVEEPDDLPITASPGDAYFITGTPVIYVWSGANGWFGPVDLSGPQGIQGPQGAQGLQGQKGDKGDKGDTGDQGLQGIQGTQGVHGLKGDKGDTGDQGPQGDQGAQGVQGPKGDTGDQGPQGTQGLQGIPGPKGDTGDQGAQGVQGLKGDKGDRGDAFTVDEQGLFSERSDFDGAAPGFSFLATDLGELYFRQGASGWSAGIPFGKGDKGDPGDDGLQGEQGPQGPQGLEGLQGPKGDQGDAGSAGAPSTVPGPKGDKGDQGDVGPAGTTTFAGLADVPYAAQAEAEAGAATDKLMTPLRTAQAIAALAGGGKITPETRTGDSTLTAADKGKIIEATGTWTQTFAANAALGAGWSVYYRSGGDITFDPSGAETIDGRASYISYPGEVRLIYSDGTALRSVVLVGYCKTFTASADWVKPPGYSWHGTYPIGGGGSGGAYRNTTSGGINGGTGGGGIPVLLPASALADIEPVVVGLGGAAVVRNSTGTTVGNNGGESSFAGIRVGGGLGGAGSTAQAGGWAISSSASPNGYPGAASGSTPGLYGGASQGANASSLYGGGAGGVAFTSGLNTAANTGRYSRSQGGAAASATSGSIVGDTGTGPGAGGGGAALLSGSGTATSGPGTDGEVQVWGAL